MAHLVFQKVQNLILISKIQRKIYKMFPVFEMVGLELFAGNNTFCDVNTCR